MSTEADAEEAPVAEAEDHPLEKMVQPTIKFAIGIVALIVAQELIFRVPGTGDVTATLPGGVEVTIARILHTVIVFLLMGVIVKYGSDIGKMLQDSTETFVKLRRMSVLIAMTVSLAVAYQLFRWIPDRYEAVQFSYYNIGFLIAGLILGGWVILIMYGNVDRV